MALSSFRVAASAAGRPWTRASRRMHQAALATLPPPLPHLELAAPLARDQKRRSQAALSVRTGLGAVEPVFELEKRVQALQAAVTEEETSLAPPFYTEQDLMVLYEDLLAIPPKPTSSQVDLEALDQRQALEDAQTIQTTEWRLSQSHSDVALGAAHQGPAQNGMQPYHRVLAQAQAITAQLEDTRKMALKGMDPPRQAVAGPSKISVPISVLSVKECEALVRACTRAQDGLAAMLTLEIMKRSGMPIPENAVTDTLEILATNGNIRVTDSLISSFTTSPTQRQRHLHVKAHLKAAPPCAIPASALTVLHTYEEKALFAPMQTYTSCITTLLSTPSSAARAQGWDLFTHMRYVAHPNPDACLYTLMIRACASPLTSSRTSEPEKALDLWTEMTVDKKIEPTVGAYNAVILACARSGVKMYVNEAYRLAKRMLDGYRDARGVSAYRPDRKTFCALLEGAKRIGDLGRARWILAELVRCGGTSEMGRNLNEPEGVRVDEEVMMHLFQAYAVYKPPFKREATVVQPGTISETPSGEESWKEEASLTEVIDDESEPTALIVDAPPSFSHIPPQSHQEVLHEVTYLFQRILDDIGVLSASALRQHNPSNSHLSLNLLNKFSDVQLTPRLLSSYISVFFRHAPLDLAQEMFWKVFDELNIQRSARVYVEALERCAYAKKGREREVAIQFADRVWNEWQSFEDAGQDGERGLSARLIERAYGARIRLYTVSDDTSKALSLLQSFVQRYPPSSIRAPPEKPFFRSTRTTLVDGSRPLVRMTSTVEVPDDGVPPLLTFRDLEVLHHRLVALERVKEVGYVKWVAKAYEWMLRVRRDEGLRLKPSRSREGLEM